MSYYDDLGIDKKANKEQIKRAYKKRASKTHPDKEGGARTDFKKVQRAYEVLSCDDKKAHYDQFGEDADNEPSTNHLLNETLLSIFKKENDHFESPRKLIINALNKSNEVISAMSIKSSAISKDIETIKNKKIDAEYVLLGMTMMKNQIDLDLLQLKKQNEIISDVNKQFKLIVKALNREPSTDAFTKIFYTGSSTAY